MVSNTSLATAYSDNETTLNNETEVEIELIFKSEILQAVGAPIARENIMAILILSRCRKLAFQIRILSLNLAVTDCLAGVFMCVPNEFDLVHVGCRYKKFLIGTLLGTSMFTVTAFNVDQCCMFYFNIRYQQYIS